MKTAKNIKSAVELEVAPVELKVRRFCSIYAMSRASFYAMCARGEGPESYIRGRTRLISVAAAERWNDEVKARAKQRAAA